MANTYFQFKKFRVSQAKSGMKVTTDGCLFGAWTADLIASTRVDRILDMGSGTGLLSLMLAQKTEAQIDAIEADKNAFFESVDNVSASPWNHRIKCYHMNADAFTPTDPYDVIICNPPFFTDSLQGQRAAKNRAIHTLDLTPSLLAQKTTQWLSPKGQAFVMYPEREMNAFLKAVRPLNLFPHRLVKVYNNPQSVVFRCMACLSSCPCEMRTEKLKIREENGTYSPAFRYLLDKYYL